MLKRKKSKTNQNEKSVCTKRFRKSITTKIDSTGSGRIAMAFIATANRSYVSNNQLTLTGKFFNFLNV